ncbi:RuBisCO-cytochrome methylase [Basidiobolus meristosporus CBS 931.73]|uniref:N-lysine methyltransferase SETD6 n=1 Tax=Basidiobolus meristosporus CBS 931.73 TaxID=1314790 RepID=A0A1Y1Y151_9FUNG|nr:RuBisCO-cytochrome methylase [Basidiobolus meristosporus CBS 931.73]|eukprot:ORX91354.1 RuBisCO-cytochrome methylase [Basidiobolus meristosporus CBS 931.73]
MKTDFEQLNENFVRWLKAEGSTFSPKIAFKDYSNEGAGRGVYALEDIKDTEVLFTLPRTVLLSVKNSELSQKLSLDELDGWNPLILCMIYESTKEDSKWSPYFEILPKEFHTPMFWSEEEQKELTGTGVIDKIGKEQAEQNFRETILPLIEEHEELFPKGVDYLSLFHRMGSLIMAYSFIDEAPSEDSDSDADSDDEVEGEVTMVPMADMLNHKTGFNNARLFYEEDRLGMCAIKNIQAGEQIFNTYGDLCSADLLRKYGFVDEENPNDIVEINGESLVNAYSTEEEDKADRVEFLLDNGILDDCFVIEVDAEIPPEMIVTAKVLSMSPADFAKLQKTEKFPKPKLTPEISQVFLELLRARASQYLTTYEEDLERYTQAKQNPDSLSRNGRNALVVRVGERTILKTAIERLEKSLREEAPSSPAKRQKTH